MEYRRLRLIGPCSLMCFLLMQGCMSPKDAVENADRALRKTEDIQAQHNALEDRADLIEQNAKKLEQRIDVESLNQLAKMREALKAQETKHNEERDRLRAELNSRLDEAHKQMELLRTDVLNAVQGTHGNLVQKVDKQFASLDAVMSTLLLRIQDLEKRLQAPRKR